MAMTWMPAAATARTNSNPGSLIAGVPASLTSATDLPSRSSAIISARTRAFVVIMQRQLRRVDPKCLSRIPGVARVLRRDQVAVFQSRARAGLKSPKLPIGVATT